LVGPTADFAQLVRVLQPQAKEILAGVLQTPAAIGRSVELCVAAVVNRWLASGERNRHELIRLANELGLKAQLASHRDLGRVFQDLTTFEYPFAIVDDGPWL